MKSIENIMIFLLKENEDKSVVYQMMGPQTSMGDHKVMIETFLFLNVYFQ